MTITRVVDFGTTASFSPSFAIPSLSSLKLVSQEVNSDHYPVAAHYVLRVGDPNQYPTVTVRRTSRSGILSLSISIKAPCVITDDVTGEVTTEDLEVVTIMKTPGEKFKDGSEYVRMLFMILKTMYDEAGTVFTAGPLDQSNMGIVDVLSDPETDAWQSFV